MSCAGAADEPFPADDGLFAETFSLESVYTWFGQELKIRQLFGAKLGVAAPVWDAALQLCRFFEERPVELRGQRVIELGAGTGVVGILAARLGAFVSVCAVEGKVRRDVKLRLLEKPNLQQLWPHSRRIRSVGASVTLTDLPSVLPQLQANVSANMPPGGWLCPPTVLPLSWGEDHTSFPSDWDLVLCADIIYLPDTFPLLVETLTHLCGRGAVVYLSSKMRAEHGTPGFYDDCLPKHFNVELLLRDDEQNISIYRASLRTERV